MNLTIKKTLETFIKFFILFNCIVWSVQCGTFKTGRKTWWAKKYDNTLFTAGRLTDRQIKYLSEEGFASIISLFPISKTEYKYGEMYPDSKEEKYIATTLCNMKHVTLLDDFDWKHPETFDKFQAAYDSMPKPILFHCKSSYSASFIAGVHVAKQYKKYIRSLQNQLHKGQEEFYRLAKIHVYDYTSDDVLRQLAADILDEPLMCNPIKSNLMIKDWYQKYFQLKPVYGNYFVAGQIQTTDIKKIIDTGIRSIINTREGVTSIKDGTPSQEEVALLNIKSGTGTYENGGRQSTAQLEANRLNPNLPNKYISDKSTINYESMNGLEYGDNIGYNESMEEQHVRIVHGLSYSLTPIETEKAFGKFYWDLYKDVWMSPGSSESVIFHCRSAVRAVKAAVLAAGMTYNKSELWMEQRVVGMGFAIEGHVRAAWAQVLLEQPKALNFNDDLHVLSPDPLCPKNGSGNIYIVFKICMGALFLYLFHLELLS